MLLLLVFVNKRYFPGDLQKSHQIESIWKQFPFSTPQALLVSINLIAASVITHVPFHCIVRIFQKNEKFCSLSLERPSCLLIFHDFSPLLFLAEFTFENCSWADDKWLCERSANQKLLVWAPPAWILRYSVPA